LTGTEERAVASVAAPVLTEAASPLARPVTLVLVAGNLLLSRPWGPAGHHAWALRGSRLPRPCRFLPQA